MANMSQALYLGVVSVLMRRQIMLVLEIIQAGVVFSVDFML